MKNFKEREIIRITELTNDQVADLRDFGFTVINIVDKLYEISVKVNG